MNFGLISEGHTDHKILKNILIGFFGEDIEESIQFLQPVGGARGGWQKVIEYCQSGNIAGDLEQNDFIILQIDTDRLHEIGLSDKDENGKKLPTLPHIERVKARLIQEIDSAEIDFYENNKDKIIFAIAVNETECWLLTLFDIKKGKLPIENSCLHHLNQHLENSKIEIKSKKGEYEKPIDPKKKDTKQYERLSDRFADDKDLLLASAKKNPSFQLFIADLTLKTN